MVTKKAFVMITNAFIPFSFLFLKNKRTSNDHISTNSVKKKNQVIILIQGENAVGMEYWSFICVLVAITTLFSNFCNNFPSTK